MSCVAHRALVTILGLFVLGTAWSNLRAQHKTLRFQHYGTAQGLSQSSALTLLQDSQGFLWVGTQNGLNRFDGYSFTRYSHAPTDSLTISASYISGIAEDARQRLWITGLAGSLDVYSPVTGSFTRLKAHRSASNNPRGRGAVLALSERKGGIWLMFQDGILVYLRPELIHLPPQQLLDSAIVCESPVTKEDATSFFEDSRGNIWIGTMSEILLVSSSHGKTPRINVKRILKTGAPVMRFGELTTYAGFLWVGTLAGLRFLDVGRGVLVPAEEHIPTNHLLLQQGVLALSEVSPGIMWVGTTVEGLLQVDTHTRQITQFQHRPSDPFSLGDNRVTAIMKDRGGTIWLGSITSGLTKVVSYAYPFRYVGYDPDDKHGIRDYDVTALHVDRKQTLWVGTRKGGLHRAQVTAAGPGQFFRYPIGEYSTSAIPDPYVKAIHEDRRGNIWIGVWALSGGLLKADAGKQTFTRFSHNPADSSSIASNLVRAIQDDVHGYLWIGTTGGGLSRIHLDSLDTPRFLNYRPNPADSTSLSMDDVFSVAISNHVPGEVWAGTFEKGLNRLDPSNEMFTHFQFSSHTSSSLCDDRVTTVIEDTTGNIWVGTFSGLALLRHDSRARGIFECFDEGDGLIDNLVQGILEDNAGTIWLSTQRGLSRFNPASQTFTNFSGGTHLPIKEFNTNSLSADAGGRLYFGGVNGFIHFDPDSIQVNTNPPPVIISSFRIFEKEAELDTPVSLKKEIRLSHDQDFLSFEFTALDFRDPGRNQYAYRMDGLHADWIHIGSRRYAAFSNLQPGEYTFRVKAANNDAVWNEEGAWLRIVIIPPFWMTSWFQVLAGFILLAGLVTSVRYISTIGLRRRLRELEVRERIREERERISSELHDNIGSHLTNLATGLEVSRRYIASRDIRELQENLGFLEGSVRTTIRSLRETIWSLQPESGTAASLAQRIEDYVDERTRLFDLPVVRKSFTGDASYLLTPSQALNLYRIGQEAINNALKHSGAKMLSVSVEISEGKLCLAVRDDGCGFDTASAYLTEGYGIANMKRRAAKIGARFEISSSSEGGTNLTVLLQPERHKPSPE